METSFRHPGRPFEPATLRPGALLSVLALALTLLVGVLAGWQAHAFIETSGVPVANAAADTSYDVVEQTRAGILFGSATDSSYDVVERARAGIVLPTTTDTSYDAVERSRAAWPGR
ncbi:MAG TPA: hypothetical protein VFO78_07330 [Candidatus Limnocylindrales bacterium]|nr:hypothetical protein [Candidatus Limnocylindrales bacterium]